LISLPQPRKNAARHFEPRTYRQVRGFIDRSA
jgi:hypothetical protein